MNSEKYYPTRPICLITGCALAVEWENKAIWGDLHQLGTIWVFNGNTKGFDSDWLFDEEARRITTSREKVVTLRSMMPYLERRGVIVFDRLHCMLNQAARNHLYSNPHYEP